MRRGIAAGVICLGVLVPAGSAQAGCAPPQLRESIDTGGVLVHYTTDPASPNAVTAADAQKLASNAQSALTDEEAKLAMPGPVPDSDGKQDVYVGTTAGCVLEGPAGVTVARHPDQPTTDAYIVLKQGEISKKQTIAHELFHTMQMAIATGGRRVIAEGTAEWAAQHLYPGQGADREIEPGLPLDCSDKACGTAPYETWPFFEFLSERYGASIGFKIFQTQAALGNQATVVQVLDATLGPLGSSAGNAYRDFAVALSGDRLTHPDLKDTSVLALDNSFRTGTKPRRVPGKRFQLDHLSSTYLDLYTSNGEHGGRCKPGSLTLTVKARGAPGAAAIVTFKRHARAVKFKGGAGKLTIRWPLCDSTEATLALVNAAAAGAPQTFAVSAVVTTKG